MIANLQDAGREQLVEGDRYPQQHPVWGGRGWKVFLNVADHIARTIGHIEKNPVPYGLPVQKHTFVSAYDGWDLRSAAR